MFDCNFAVVCDCGPDADGLPGDVATSVQPDPTRDRTGRHAGQPDLVLNLTMERLLKGREKRTETNYIMSFYKQILINLE